MKNLCDSPFINHHDLARFPADTTVTLANGTTVTAGEAIKHGLPVVAVLVVRDYQQQYRATD